MSQLQCVHIVTGGGKMRASKFHRRVIGNYANSVDTFDCLYMVCCMAEQYYCRLYM